MLKRSLISLGLATTVAAALSVFGTDPSAAQEKIRLRCNSVFPLASALSAPQIRWGKEVARLSNGRITTQDLALALYKAGEAPDGLGGGLADCGSMNFYYPEVMPVANDTGSMPFVWNETMYADWVNIPFIGEVLTQELASVKIVPLIGAPGAQSFFMLKPLPNGSAPEDMSKTFEGLRIRTWGVYTDVVRLLGGTPVAMPANEVPVALRQGLIDGLITSWDTWKSQSMQADAPYAYHIPAMGGGMFGINKAKWDSFSVEDQKLMREAAVTVAKEIATETTEFKQSIIDEAKANPSLHVIELTPEEAGRWRAALSSIMDGYASRSPKHKQYLDTLTKYFQEGYTPSWQR
jgi:TRAP-type C4-dicarboxylate transport system substrate-binding protein